MTGGLVWALLALSFGVIMVRRRRPAIALVTVQAVMIVVIAAAPGAQAVPDFLVSAIALSVRAVALGLVLTLTVRRTLEPQPVKPGWPAIARLAVTMALVIAVSRLLPEFGLGSPAAERVAVSLVVAGLATVMLRRPTIFQLLGLLQAENGLSLAAVSVPGGVPLIIDLGLVVDISIIVVVATVFHERIFGHLGTANTSLLKELHD